jgi:oleandomycin transport system permease protein
VRPADPPDLGAVADLLSRFADGNGPVTHDSFVTVAVTDGSVLVSVVRLLDDVGVTVEALSLRQPSLDEAFLSLTGHRPEGAWRNAGSLKGAWHEFCDPRAWIRADNRGAWSRLHYRPAQCMSGRTPAARGYDHPAADVLVLFVYVFGGAIAGSSADYLQFALPGILVQGTAFTPFTTALGLNQDFDKGLVDRFRSLPIARSAVIAGRVLADAVRVVWGSLVIVGFGLLLGVPVRGGSTRRSGRVGLVVAFGVTMCWPMAFIGVSTKSAEAANTWGFKVLFPLTFASSAFAAPETMPGWLEAFATVNPITKVIDTTPGLMLGGPVGEPLGATLLWLVTITGLFAPLAIARFRPVSRFRTSSDLLCAVRSALRRARKIPPPVPPSRDVRTTSRPYRERHEASPRPDQGEAHAAERLDRVSGARADGRTAQRGGARAPRPGGRSL